MSDFDEKISRIEEISWVPAAEQAAWNVTIGQKKATELVVKLGLPDWKIAAISRVFNFLIHSDLQAGKGHDEAMKRIDGIVSSFQ